MAENEDLPQYDSESDKVLAKELNIEKDYADISYFTGGCCCNFGTKRSTDRKPHFNHCCQFPRFPSET
jgi:hypothetical protein